MARFEPVETVEHPEAEEDRIAGTVAEKVRNHLRQARESKGEDIKTTIHYPIHHGSGERAPHVITTAKITIVD